MFSEAIMYSCGRTKRQSFFVMVEHGYSKMCYPVGSSASVMLSSMSVYCGSVDYKES